MRSSIKKVSEIIEKEDAFTQVRNKAKEYEVVDKFLMVFPELKNIAEPKKIENGILFLRVENSVWRSELNFNKSLMIEKINKALKNNFVRTIKFL